MVEEGGHRTAGLVTPFLEDTRSPVAAEGSEGPRSESGSEFYRPVPWLGLRLGPEPGCGWPLNLRV